MLLTALLKLYCDMVLRARLNRWFSLYQKQAGSQTERGCLEHVVTLCLLCDVARRKKFKLYVTFAGFPQASGKVPRTFSMNPDVTKHDIVMYNYRFSLL